VRRLALALLVTVAGCSTLSSSSTQSSSAEAQSQITVPVSSPPPPEKAENGRPAAPGFGYIWVGGYWDYLDGNYIWRDGRWVQGKPDYEYIRARYEYDGKAWVFHRPHWKRRQKATETTTPAPKQ
jgi:hypothetical protein